MKRTIISIIGVVVLLTMFLATATPVAAARAFDSITLDGSSSATVAPGATITVVMTVTTSGSNNNDDWRSTSWYIGTSPPDWWEWNCVDHGNHNNDGTYTETFTITAPMTDGTYNAYFRAYEDDGCSFWGNYNETVMNGAITVLSGPSYTLTVNTSGSGTVTKIPDQSAYTSGTVVTLVANPDGGQYFTGWTGDLSGAATPTNITMDGNKTVTANFDTETPSCVTVYSQTPYSITQEASSPNYEWQNLVLPTGMPDSSGIWDPEDDWAYTYFTSAGNSRIIYLSDFQFAIPSGATITGIRIEYERHADGSVTDSLIQLMKNGVPVGTPKSGASWAPTGQGDYVDEVAYFGVPCDLWGTTWTRDDINNSGFGVAVAAQGASGATAYIDDLDITVFYDCECPGPSCRLNVTTNPKTNATLYIYDVTLGNGTYTPSDPGWISDGDYLESFNDFIPCGDCYEVWVTRPGWTYLVKGLTGQASSWTGLDTKTAEGCTVEGQYNVHFEGTECLLPEATAPPVTLCPDYSYEELVAAVAAAGGGCECGTHPCTVESITDNGDDTYTVTCENECGETTADGDILYPQCGACQECVDGACQNICAGTDTECGCETCENCNDLDGPYPVGSPYTCCSDDGLGTCTCQDYRNRDYYCYDHGCTYTEGDLYTVKESCTACPPNEWVNVGSPYACCSDDGTGTCTCQDQNELHYYCDGDTCLSEVVGFQTVRISCTACPADEWVDVGSSYACCDPSGEACTCQDQELLHYYCDGGTCLSEPVDGRTLYNDCSACPADEWVNIGSSYACCDPASGEACTCQDQELLHYYCDGGTCLSTPVDYQTVYSGCTACPADEWVDVGSSYPCCNQDGEACTCQDQELLHYYCDGGSCLSTPVDYQTVYSGCTACPADEWVDVGSSYACCDPASGEACTCQDQELLHYYCDGGSCLSEPVDSQTVYSGCTACPADEWVDVGSSYPCCNQDGEACTCQDQLLLHYYCDGGSCVSTPVDSRTVRSGCTACPADEWVDVGSSYACCDPASGEACTCQDQLLIHYYCDGGSCLSEPVDSRTVRSGCTACPADEWVDVGSSYACCDPSSGEACTCQDQLLIHYYCDGGTCLSTPVDGRTLYSGCIDCSLQDGWVNDGDPYPCCDGNSSCMCQDQDYLTYTCSGGSCISSVTDEQTLIVPDSCTDCGTDYYTDWEYYCEGGDVWRTRDFHDFYCLDGDCHEDVIPEYEPYEDCGVCQTCEGAECVNTCNAEAGPDQIIALGGSVVIGGSPTSSCAPECSFSWLPTAGLNDPTSPNPTASPAATTTYTVTVHYSDGCEVFDSMTVTVASPPPPGGTPGPDKCYMIVDMLGERTLVEIDCCTNTTVEECEAYDENLVHLFELEDETLVQCGECEGCNCYPKIIVMSLSEETIEPPDGMTMVGPLYDFTGYKDIRQELACDLATYFDPTATILLNYDPELLADGASEPVIGFFSHVDNQWVLLPPDAGRVAEIGTASGVTGYFASPFAVLASAPPEEVVEPEPATPSPAHFVASGLSITPAEVKKGEAVTISLNVANDGEEGGTYTVELLINGSAIDSKIVTLGGGEDQAVSFAVSASEAGTYDASAAGLNGSFTVVKSSMWWIYLIIAAAVILLGLMALRFRRKPAKK